MAEQKKTSPAEFLRQVQTEGRKVVWPTREETVRTAIFVFIMMVILSLFFLGVDSAFGAVVRWLSCPGASRSPTPMSASRTAAASVPAVLLE